MQEKGFSSLAVRKAGSNRVEKNAPDSTIDAALKFVKALGHTPWFRLTIRQENHRGPSEGGNVRNYAL